MLTINKTVENEKAVLVLEGRLDTVTAPELEEALKEILPDTLKLTLDFADLEYISSAGLRVLLMAVKKLGADSVTVCNTSDAVKEIFETTGFDQLITVR